MALCFMIEAPVARVHGQGLRNIFLGAVPDYHGCTPRFHKPGGCKNGIGPNRQSAASFEQIHSLEMCASAAGYIRPCMLAGKECGHCHLCPEGEIKACPKWGFNISPDVATTFQARKRAKQTVMRLGLATTEPWLAASGICNPASLTSSLG